MTLSIDFNEIKNGAIAAYHTAAARISEWTGRMITILKSGVEKARPYLTPQTLQDKRIAAISLIAVTMLLILAAEAVNYVVTRPLPQNTEVQVAFRDLLGESAGLATIAGGVYAFSKYAKLPFTPLAIAGISATTFLVVVLCKKEPVEKPKSI
jgi:hypothetical protein